MILGITGGLGCGKSTASRIFAAAGFALIDSDGLIRERVLTDPSVIAALRDRFGEVVIDAAGQVNRAALAAPIFADDDARRWLEALTHPLLFKLWRGFLAKEPSGRHVVEVPLLFEHALENWFDFTICVACSSAQQLVRLERRGLSPVLAGQRISKQLPLAQKIELADIVLWNEGSAVFLHDQVTRLITALPETC